MGAASPTACAWLSCLALTSGARAPPPACSAGPWEDQIVKEVSFTHDGVYIEFPENPLLVHRLVHYLLVHHLSCLLRHLLLFVLPRSEQPATR